MPDRSPSDARLLEPVDVGTELRATSTDNLANQLQLAHDEEQPAGFIKKRMGVVFWIAVGWMVLVIVLAVLAPVLTNSGIIPDPNKIGRPINSGPVAGHILGTDSLGRDQLSRLIWGARVSLP